MKEHQYVIDPTDTWREVTGGYDWPHNPYEVRTFVRDLVERRNGQLVHTWRDGAYQVTGGGRAKTFKGESAWSAAAREHGDRITRERFK